MKRRLSIVAAMALGVLVAACVPPSRDLPGEFKRWPTDEWRRGARGGTIDLSLAMWAARSRARFHALDVRYLQAVLEVLSAERQSIWGTRRVLVLLPEVSSLTGVDRRVPVDGSFDPTVLANGRTEWERQQRLFIKSPYMPVDLENEVEGLCRRIKRFLMEKSQATEAEIASVEALIGRVPAVDLKAVYEDALQDHPEGGTLARAAAEKLPTLLAAPAERAKPTAGERFLSFLEVMHGKWTPPKPGEKDVQLEADYAVLNRAIRGDSVLLSAALERTITPSMNYGLDPRYLQSVLFAQRISKYDREPLFGQSVLQLHRERNSVTGVSRPPGPYDEQALTDDVARAAQQLARTLSSNGASAAEMASAGLLLETRPEAIDELFNAYFMDHDRQNELVIEARAQLLRSLGKNWRGAR